MNTFSSFSLFSTGSKNVEMEEKIETRKWKMFLLTKQGLNFFGHFFFIVFDWIVLIEISIVFQIIQGKWHWNELLITLVFIYRFYIWKNKPFHCNNCYQFTPILDSLLEKELCTSWSPFRISLHQISRPVLLVSKTEFKSFG